MKKKILITRPEPFATQLAQAMYAAGFDTILCPMLEIVEPRKMTSLEKLFQDLNFFDFAIFISPTAVLKTFSKLKKPWPTHIKVFAIGQGTAKALMSQGISKVIFPTSFCSESLLAMEELKNVKNKKIIIFRGKGGRPLLGNALEAQEACVSHAVVYERKMPAILREKQLKLWKEARIDAIVVSSQEALENMISLVGEKEKCWLQQQCFLVTSLKTQAYAHHQGFKTVLLARDASDQAIIDVLFRRT
ncbi:MAG: hypothetical protein A3I12_07120 [Gammaproteobacteria bacterium RIFCSPLOWO2_02_FULL_38_11]|nr:MAG: hypothetical protein A2W47_05500 [Gammaproteobacteria bacterium RIFCSPHIGHO2_12_38_15]OGT66774.1 MAG: hypothetical protein A3I12_07120 [Gammaproteobacteria bacterium RIFCSPLOWO2_02_FULL_38_11]OGT77984.1 MAG: hypothetical protein A3G71_04970 [Gammaproteobacteria bacterium RIFCSPLOWO2_12_FULL_38_14]